MTEEGSRSVQMNKSSTPSATSEQCNDFGHHNQRRQLPIVRAMRYKPLDCRTARYQRTNQKENGSLRLTAVGAQSNIAHRDQPDFPKTMRRTKKRMELGEIQPTVLSRVSASQIYSPDSTRQLLVGRIKSGPVLPNILMSLIRRSTRPSIFRQLT